MFQKIQELIDEKEALVFVLIDEVNLALVFLPRSRRLLLLRLDMID